MCEFCKEHGEGKKWYLEMKNYSEALLDEEVSGKAREAAQTRTRGEWVDMFMRYFILPATGKYPAPAAPEGGPPLAQISPEEALERSKLVHFGQVLPIEDVEAVIDMVDSITRFPCGCRYLTTGKADKRYCFGVGVDRWGILGKYPDAASSLETLDKAEAKRIFRQYDQEGLIHSVWTAITPFVVGLCNCDRDCGAYKGYIEMRGSPSFFRAEYVCAVDWDVCTGCKSCMKQCQFGAQFYSSALGKVYIDPARCFGCGVCRAACPNDAIQLLPRESNPQAANLWLREPEAAV